MSRAPPRERWSSADVEGEATCVASRARRLARVRASESAEEEEEEAREDSSTASTASRRRSDDGDGEGSRKSMGSRTASMLGSLSLRAETIDPNVPSVLQKLQKWGDYASCGDVVEGTRLVPMKTPLSRVYVDEGCVNALTMSGLMMEPVSYTHLTLPTKA